LESPLTGSEIMALTGLEPGVEIGRLKTLLTEKVLDGELAPSDKDRAAQILSQLPRGDAR